MQSLRTVQVLLSICVFTSTAVLCGMAMGSAASQQMAAKRRISLQLQQDMRMCEHLDGTSAQYCKRQAHGWAEVAKADLHALRKGPRQVRHARAVNAWPAPERS